MVILYSKYDVISISEMKKEIEEKIGSLNDTQLGFVLDVINKIKIHEDGSKMDMDMIFEEAAEKYGDVLKKFVE